MEFSCSIINFEEYKIYVLQMSGENVIFSYIKTESGNAFFYNMCGQIRECVSGIANNVKMISENISKTALQKNNNRIDIILADCYKLLKTATDATELIKYAEDMNSPQKIDLKKFLEDFIKKCQDAVKKQFNFILNTKGEIYIKVDIERLTSCMLALIALAGSGTDCNSILLNAEKVGDYVSVTVAAKDVKGVRVERIKLTSNFNKLYENESADPNVIIVCRFCHTYNGTFFSADNPDSKDKIYSLKIPYCDSYEPTIELRSPHYNYPESKFNNFHAVLSDIANIK